MNEDSETLAELMLHADQFCSKIEAAMKDVAPNPEQKELRTKLGQFSGQMCLLPWQDGAVITFSTLFDPASLFARFLASLKLKGQLMKAVHNSDVPSCAPAME